MRSGMISYSVPCSSSTPSITIVSVPWPRTSAPIATKKFAEIDDFGFHRDVTQRGRPFGYTAASIAFLVAPTLGKRNSIAAPCSRPVFRFCDQIAVRVANFAAERDERTLVHVGRTRPQNASAG